MNPSSCRIEQEDRYDDGVFRVGRKHGFLPQRSPLARLPSPFEPIQALLDELPVWLEPNTQQRGVLATPGLIATRVSVLPNLAGEVASIIASIQGDP